MNDLLIPLIAAIIATIVAMLLAKRRKKVDKGFAVNYYRLSYRRKLMRTLYVLPVYIILIASFIALDVSTTIIVIFTVISAVTFFAQLIYNYVMYKKHEA